MYLAPGAQYCPNCQLNLAQFAYQQQAMGFQTAPGADLPEGRKEKVYRKTLIGICIALFSDMLIRHLPDLFDGSFIYTAIKPFRYVVTIGWAGLPLLIALILPKKSPLRVLFIVLASIYALAAVWYWMYYEFFYYTWNEDYLDYE